MNNKLYKLMNWPKIEEIIYSESDNPHALLGPHKAGNQTLVQAFFPNAERVELILDDNGNKYPMELADDDGYFAVLVPVSEKDLPKYHYILEDKSGKRTEWGEPYRFKPLITQEDTDKFRNGIHYTIYEKLGAHPMTIDNTEGTYFAVWAPNAMRISVVGDFNGWDGRIHQMRRLRDSGIFELFIPGAKKGDNYKYELKLKGGTTYLKSDPYGNAAQMRPENASVITDLSDFSWEDDKFIKGRGKYQDSQAPVSVYEMYLGSFLKGKEGTEFANYRDIADGLIPYLKDMGFTHVELMPIMEHPLDESWGYQVIGYYAPTARYGTPQDFMYLVNELHKAGIGIILDWVPAHFPRDVYGLSNFDGTCLYEHRDPRQSFHAHWGTLIYNYGRPEVSNYLIANALFWVEKYHVDGIRMDAVASMLYLDYGKQDGQWIANIYGGNENLEAIEMMKHLNSIMKKRNPGVLTIAEESTAFPKITGELNDGGLGFDLKWNMGFMNDYINYIRNDPYFRSYHHGELTFSMIYQYSEKYMMPFSHDEVVHGKATLIGKMPGSREQKFAGLRLTFAYMMTHPGRKLLFMGQELGEFDEWNEKRQVQWELKNVPEHAGISRLVKDLNGLYKSCPELHVLDDDANGFEWINNISANESYITFARKGEKDGEILVVAANFSGVALNLTTGVPKNGKYKEIFNSDSRDYGGTNMVNSKVIRSKMIEWDDRENSINVKLAPLSLSILKYIPLTKEELVKEEQQRVALEQERLKKEQELLKKEQEKLELEQKRLLEEEKKLSEKKNAKNTSEKEKENNARKKMSRNE